MAKEKKSKRRSNSPKTFSMGGVKQYAKKGAALVGGIALGTIIQKFIAKKDAVTGTDLLGLDGNTSKYTTPALMIAAGMAAHALVKDETLKTVALGLGAAGGVNLVNSIAGETKIALSGSEEPAQPALMPGVGEIVDEDYLEKSATTETPDGFQIEGDDEPNDGGVGDTDYSLINGTENIL